MAKRDIKTLQKAYEAFAKGDIEGATAHMSPQIQWYESTEGLPWSGRHRGPKAVVEKVFGPASTQIQGLTVKPEEFLSDGDTVVVLGNFGGKGADGKRFKTRFAHAWKFRDGKAVRHENFTDPTPFVRALGKPGRKYGYPRGG